jgi:hypothetical protein
MFNLSRVRCEAAGLVLQRRRRALDLSDRQPNGLGGFLQVQAAKTADNLGNSEHRARGVRRKLCLIILQDNDRCGHALIIDPELLQPLRCREHD